MNRSGQSAWPTCPTISICRDWERTICICAERNVDVTIFKSCYWRLLANIFHLSETNVCKFYPQHHEVEWSASSSKRPAEIMLRSEAITQAQKIKLINKENIKETLDYKSSRTCETECWQQLGKRPLNPELEVITSAIMDQISENDTHFDTDG